MKDFFHETNDIALAIVIVLLAAGIIFWRLQIILDYPAQAAKAVTSSAEVQTEEVQDSAETSN